MSNRDFIIVAIRFFGFYLLVVALQNGWSLFETYGMFQVFPPHVFEVIPLHQIRIVKAFIQMGIPAMFGVYMVVAGSSFYRKSSKKDDGTVMNKSNENDCLMKLNV